MCARRGRVCGRAAHGEIVIRGYRPRARRVFRRLPQGGVLRRRCHGGANDCGVQADVAVVVGGEGAAAVVGAAGVVRVVVVVGAGAIVVAVVAVNHVVCVVADVVAVSAYIINRGSSGAVFEPVPISLLTNTSLNK